MLKIFRYILLFFFLISRTSSTFALLKTYSFNAPSGSTFSNFPPNYPMCADKDNIWIINVLKTPEKKCYANLYCIDSNLKILKTFPIIPITDKNISITNLCILGDGSIVFSLDYENKDVICIFNPKDNSMTGFNPKLMKISSIKPIDGNKFLVLGSGNVNTDISIVKAASIFVFEKSGMMISYYFEKSQYPDSDLSFETATILPNGNIAAWMLDMQMPKSGAVLTKILNSKYSGRVFVFNADLKVCARSEVIKGNFCLGMGAAKEDNFGLVFYSTSDLDADNTDVEVRKFTAFGKENNTAIDSSAPLLCKFEVKNAFCLNAYFYQSDGNSYMFLNSQGINPVYTVLKKDGSIKKKPMPIPQGLNITGLRVIQNKAFVLGSQDFSNIKKMDLITFDLTP